MLALDDPVAFFADVLSEPGDRTRHVDLSRQWFHSLLTQIDGRAALEVGIADCSPACAHTGSGLGLARRPSAFMRELDESAALRKLLTRYAYVLMQQLAASAACLRFHGVGPRLARWLLMCQDRAHANNFLRRRS